MPNNLIVRTIPSNEIGLTLNTTTPVWTLTPWKVIASRIPNDIYITGLDFQFLPSMGGNDTTYHLIFEIGIGKPHNAVTKIQIPNSIRGDTLAAFFYTKTYTVFLPEPVLIKEANTICIRAASSFNGVSYFQGIKLSYQSNTALPNPSVTIGANNYKFLSVGEGMSVSEKIR